jgi:acyl-CoA synthetase (NDP forming)
VTAFLARLPGGGWLPAGEVSELLGCYGVPLAGTGERAVAAGGAQMMAGAVQDPVFGPLVLFGSGGAAAEAAGGQAARLAPLTGADADELIRSVRAAPLLPGQRGGPAVDVAGLRDVLLRVSKLADDLPQVAELELGPVLARPGGVSAVAARVRVTCRELADPFLRQLRPPAPPH